jgi:NAD-dependent deacetylase
MNKEKIAHLNMLIETAGDRSIVFFGGAGVSTESGIPDFRSEEGLYKAKKEYGYSPEMMISHSFLMNKPDIFYKYYKENLIYPDAKPNSAHKALADLEKDEKLLAIVTQNIDNLHQLAGSENVFELHGSVYRNYCLECGKKFDLPYIMDESNCKDSVPVCDACAGMIRPDVTLYEEALNDAVVSRAIDAITRADILIVGGTSLVVYPAASYISYFKGSELVLINLQETTYDSRASLVIHEKLGTVLG